MYWVHSREDKCSPRPVEMFKSNSSRNAFVGYNISYDDYFALKMRINKTLAAILFKSIICLTQN